MNDSAVPPSPPASPNEQLAQLLGFLEHDPDNLPLLADCAKAAFEANKPEQARALIDRFSALAEMPPGLVTLRGLVAQQEGDFATASEVFGGQLAAGQTNPHLRFNLAWAKAMLGEREEAAALLDDEVVAANPRGGTLKVQMPHYLGDLDVTLAEGQRLAAICPQNQAMLGALAVVAFDAEDAALAARFAEASPNSYDGMSTGGMLKLAGQDVDGALDLFERALGMWSEQPRALLGKGLALLLRGQSKEAAAILEKAATLFGSHLGSWVAAGWGHYTAGDRKAARRCFAKSLVLDDTFAESHGALAVLDIAEGHFDRARRGAQVAMRLDRKCLSGALATSLLAEHDLNPALAQKIRDRAMALPIGPNGETIAQALIGFGGKQH